MNDVKRCCRCRTEFPATPEYFSRQRRRGIEGFTSQCKQCRKKMWQVQYERHRDKLIARSTETTRERRLDPAKRATENVASKLAARERLKDPTEREKHRAQVRGWFRNNRDRVNQLPSRAKPIRAHYAMRYAADKLKATPPWADLEKIKERYFEAARLTEETGVPHEVDHEIPLRNPRVCGLHVHFNLRVVPQAINRAKSNSFIFEE